MSEQWVSASEVGEYLYCQRAWWLRNVVDVETVETPAQQAGLDYHEQHAQRVATGRLQRWLAYACVIIAVALVVFWLLTIGL
jgi:CRISPR/Cas system-associated exonuclease Cas4 (RecB family)